MVLTERLAKRRGFTLIELLIVIVILGILATILNRGDVRVCLDPSGLLGRPKNLRIEDRGKEHTDITAIESALQLYKIDNGTYPTTEQGLEALLKKPDTPPIPAKWRDGGYLVGNSVPKDPWGNPYSYASPTQDGKDYEIVSYGRTGQPGGTGADAEISSNDLSKD